MSSILKVSEIQDPTNGNTALEVDSSGRVAVSQQEMFRKADGNLITRPHFIASSNSGSNFTHAHTSTLVEGHA